MTNKGVLTPWRMRTVANPTLAATIGVMRTEANKAKKSLRPLAEKVTAGIEPGDYNSEIYALYSWVRQNVRYAKDPHDVELVKSPVKLIETGQGDCDDIACLLASLCMAMGHECRFVVVGIDDPNPSHVFCQCAVRATSPNGSADGSARGQKLWVTLDPVADERTAEMHGRVMTAQVYGL